MIRRMSSCLALLAVAACSPGDQRMSDELKKDLDIASTNSGLELASDAAVRQQVVSAIERSEPSPRRMAASQRVARPRQVAEAPPESVEDPSAEESEELEPQSIEPSPVATDDAPPVAPRPRPIQVSYPGGYGGGRAGSGSSRGTGIGDIFTVVVIRGGGVDGDRCEEHDRARRGGARPTIAINNRIPIFRGTFPRN